MAWIRFAVLLALQLLVLGQSADQQVSASNDPTITKTNTGNVQRDFQMTPAEGWRDCMLLAATPWGIGTTMYPQMPP